MTTKPSLDDILAMPLRDIADLPAECLALLVDDLVARVERCRRLQQVINIALHLRQTPRS